VRSWVTSELAFVMTLRDNLAIDQYYRSNWHVFMLNSQQRLFNG
jgi:hypothetical protein